MLQSLAVVPVTSIQNAAASPVDLTPQAAAPVVSDAGQQVEHASPSLQLDPAVGIVVIQYRSASGKVELSIPSQQQLDAYANNPSTKSSAEGADTVA